MKLLLSSKRSSVVFIKSTINNISFLNKNCFSIFNTPKSDNLCVSYKEKKILGWPKEYIFDIVKDVQRYNEFVPWCLKSEILKNKNDKPNTELSSVSFNAKLEVGFPPIKESYISHVTYIKPRIVKTVAIKTTFFEYINAEWKFYAYDHLTDKIILKEELDKTYQCCAVEFYVSFKFRSNLYSQFSTLFLDNIFKKMVTAFIKRAHYLYGDPKFNPKEII